MENFENNFKKVLVISKIRDELKLKLKFETIKKNF